MHQRLDCWPARRLLRVQQIARGSRGSVCALHRAALLPGSRATIHATALERSHLHVQMLLNGSTRTCQGRCLRTCWFRSSSGCRQSSSEYLNLTQTRTLHAPQPPLARQPAGAGALRRPAQPEPAQEGRALTLGAGAADGRAGLSRHGAGSRERGPRTDAAAVLAPAPRGALDVAARTQPPAGPRRCGLVAQRGRRRRGRPGVSPGGAGALTAE